MRLEYEGLHKAEAITTPGARFFKDPAGFAMDRYAYYVCYKCNKVGLYVSPSGIARMELFLRTSRKTLENYA